MYGYQIAQELKRRSEGYFEMKEGLLYPALHRMERDGWRC
jgi:DNA-binding PadR family transcriptional regulator